MNAFVEFVSSTGSSALSSSIDHFSRSPFRDGLLSGTHIEGLFAATLVLVFMTVALLKPEWMG